MTVDIYFTGTLITPDDSDTNVYGEPCEPGYGESMADGWVDPDWSLWTVWETREDVRPHTIDSEDLEDPEDPEEFRRAILEGIGDVLGAIDYTDGHSFYAADELIDYRDGERMSLAAHLYTPNPEDPDNPTPYYLEDPTQ